jgi:ATP-binding cassette subfamily F protein 3
LSKIESEIASLESEVAKLDIELANDYDAVAARPNFFENYKGKKAQIDTLMENWEVVENQMTNFS